mgnify:CR=1 FL=1
MRILYVCDALAIYGGLERVLVDKANWLVENGGYEVCLLTVNQGPHPICFPLHPNVLYNDLNIRFHQYSHLPFWKRVIKKRQLYHLFRKRLARKIREEAPDIIICTRLGYVRAIVQVKGVIPLVFECHSSCLESRFEGDSMLRRIFNWYLMLAVRKVEMVVALTNGDAGEWRKQTSNVCVIPNVVHLNNSGSYSDCMAKSVIFVGRFSRQKDISSLLHIWTHVYKSHPDWSLHIYGGYGEEQEMLFAEIKQMNANIQVHEPTTDVIEKYKENSILLLTSRFEPFGLVLPEAMSCGLPVVAYDCPYGPADIITDGIDGFLVREGRCEEFVNKVCLLMEDGDLRFKMGEAGVESSRRYSEGCIMPLWQQLFNQLVKH